MILNEHHTSSIQANMWLDFSTLPFYWISKHDDDFGTWLDCVDKVLGQERGLLLLPVSREIAPGLIIPHSGCTGFTCQDSDSLSIILGIDSTFKLQQVEQKHRHHVAKLS